LVNKLKTLMHWTSSVMRRWYYKIISTKVLLQFFRPTFLNQLTFF
jgi:hypothetical protein